MISICCKKHVKEIVIFELREALARVVIRIVKVYVINGTLWSVDSSGKVIYTVRNERKRKSY